MQTSVIAPVIEASTTKPCASFPLLNALTSGSAA